MINNRGVSLVEVLIALGIFLIVAVGATTLFMFASKSNRVVWLQLAAQNEGRNAVVNFTNELRGANSSSLGAYALAEAGSQQIIFYSNIDTDLYLEKVRYFKDGTLLKKGITKPSGSPLSYDSGNEVVAIVVSDIFNGADPVFYYYGEGNTGAGIPLTQPVNVNNVHFAKISLVIEENPESSPTAFRIESGAEMRNLKQN